MTLIELLLLSIVAVQACANPERTSGISFATCESINRTHRLVLESFDFRLTYNALSRADGLRQPLTPDSFSAAVHLAISDLIRSPASGDVFATHIDTLVGLLSPDNAVRVKFEQDWDVRRKKPRTTELPALLQLAPEVNDAYKSLLELHRRLCDILFVKNDGLEGRVHLWAYLQLDVFSWSTLGSTPMGMDPCLLNFTYEPLLGYGNIILLGCNCSRVRSGTGASDAELSVAVGVSGTVGEGSTTQTSYHYRQFFRRTGTLELVPDVFDVCPGMEDPIMRLYPGWSQPSMFESEHLEPGVDSNGRETKRRKTHPVRVMPGLVGLHTHVTQCRIPHFIDTLRGGGMLNITFIALAKNAVDTAAFWGTFNQDCTSDNEAPLPHAYHPLCMFRGIQRFAGSERMMVYVLDKALGNALATWPLTDAARQQATEWRECFAVVYDTFTSPDTDREAILHAKAVDRWRNKTDTEKAATAALFSASMKARPDTEKAATAALLSASVTAWQASRTDAEKAATAARQSASMKAVHAARRAREQAASGAPTQYGNLRDFLANSSRVLAPPGGVSQISFGDYTPGPTAAQHYQQPQPQDYPPQQQQQQQQYGGGGGGGPPAGRGPGVSPRAGQVQFGGPDAPPNTYHTASGAYGNTTDMSSGGGSPGQTGPANNNYQRPNGMQNVGNFLTDRPSSRVLAPPGGKSQISFG